MKKVVILATILAMGTGLKAKSDACGYENRPLLDLISAFAEESGTKFVLDPRVRSRVDHIGVTEDLHVDGAVLVGIFRSLEFSAYQSDGVVYVLPVRSGDMISEELGTLWEG